MTEPHTLPKVALITGSAERLGAATARTLHARGWNVLIHYRSKANAATALADSLNQQRPDSARTLHADLAKQEELEALARQAVATWQRLDALINNASSFYPTPLGNSRQQDWDDLFASNARAPFFLSQALIPALAQQRGSIINMIDIHASRPLQQHSLYCMAKAALLMMTKAMARELAPNIRVNGIAPGAILWPNATPDSATQERILAGIPMGQLGSPDDIARSIVFLLEDAPYITGQILAVDGGRSL